VFFLFVCSIKCVAAGLTTHWRHMLCCRQTKKRAEKVNKQIVIDAFINWIYRGARNFFGYLK